MKILIEIPNWLGDTVMATSAIENIVKHFENCEITIVGSEVSVEIFKYHPNVKKSVINDTKNSSFRYIKLFKLAKRLGSFDLFISFRKSFSSKIFSFFVKAKKKCLYKRVENNKHLVLMYNDFINRCLKVDYEANDLKIYTSPYLVKQKTLRPIVGINPGATYGSAKRWDEEKFAQTAMYLSKFFDIIIFGGEKEVNIAKNIENRLKELNVKNFINLSGKTTIESLINYISNLSLFITNDSGPMHIASAFDIPMVAIFGPTNEKETAPFSKKSEIVKKDFSCSPCMKRECPLQGDENHQCMKAIEVSDVLEKVSLVLRK